MWRSSTILAVVVAGHLYGCGSQCAKEEIDGTYAVTTTERSGTCGSLPEYVVQYQDGETVADTGCTINYERVSKDQCTTEQSLSCQNADGTSSEGVGVVTQEPGGATATGTLSVTIKDASGSVVCMSTYDATYTRQ